MSYDEIKSAKALVCHRPLVSSAGDATMFCVVLADGMIIDCGYDNFAQKRAKMLADAVNAAGPERFSQASMRASA